MAIACTPAEAKRSGSGCDQARVVADVVVQRVEREVATHDSVLGQAGVFGLEQDRGRATLQFIGRQQALEGRGAGRQRPDAGRWVESGVDRLLRDHGRVAPEVDRHVR